jgi:hypothetical protein
MDVSDLHDDLSHAVAPIRRFELKENKPKSEPCIVILADPVTPIFSRLFKLTMPISEEKAPEILPIRLPEVTRTR